MSDYKATINTTLALNISRTAAFDYLGNSALDHLKTDLSMTDTCKQMTVANSVRPALVAASRAAGATTKQAPPL